MYIQGSKIDAVLSTVVYDHTLHYVKLNVAVKLHGYQRPSGRSSNRLGQFHACPAPSFTTTFARRISHSILKEGDSK